MAEAYIVWNKGRNEAVVFLDLGDALSATDGVPRGFGISSLADEFYKAYGEDEALVVEGIILPDKAEDDG